MELKINTKNIIQLHRAAGLAKGLSEGIAFDGFNKDGVVKGLEEIQDIISDVLNEANGLDPMSIQAMKLLRKGGSLEDVKELFMEDVKPLINSAKKQV